MLDPRDKKAFDAMVARIHAEDPEFVQRIDTVRFPRRRFRTTMAVLLWMMAPFCIFLGGWTGLFMAVVAVGYGVHLMKKRFDVAGGATHFSWWSSGKRPGASL